MEYRRDLDGLRAVAVLSVVAFHSGVEALSGGYVGVDIFFVISGYIITTMIKSELETNSFSFIAFYKRRLARLLPSLILTLTMVLFFGLFFYSDKALDKLGKEVFFSSFGAVNILYAQGVNYFTADAAYQPLMHLWSLGVEEQFYLVWPLCFLVLFRFAEVAVIPAAIFTFITTTVLAIFAAQEGDHEAYYLIQYRANELLLGAITALIVKNKYLSATNLDKNKVLPYLGLSLILTPMFIYDENTLFPGFNALWPCLGVAILIVFPNAGFVKKALSGRMLVGIGLISYPLYLYHQPLISFFHFFEWKLPPLFIFFLVFSAAAFLGFCTYLYVEKPVRTIARSQNRKATLISVFLCSSVISMSLMGAAIAKNNGLPERFMIMNPYALTISEAHASTFHENFPRGLNVSAENDRKVLFVGDSVLQHYILPITMALGLDTADVDTVTRGGCVLLKGVIFKDKYADISCNDIRDELYSLNKEYDLVVISQAWDSYEDSVLNYVVHDNDNMRWKTFIDQTIEHFSHFSDKIVLIGGHPRASGVNGLQPSISITEEEYLAGLSRLAIVNQKQLIETQDFFVSFEQQDGVVVLQPHEIFCIDQCVLSDDTWSYFSDSQHITSAATRFVSDRLSHLLDDKL
ncbi:acyltransferase family protein [Billgrantia sp. LNSP4103-1]|uniref:acyltransferase family protein n=1 Tax=Billgrantia sp. LNSP4103-1 TaxID=3410266 RepID=UPI00403F2345